MTWYTRGLSLSPGNEQSLYWGSEAADQEGSRNWMGVQSPAIDGLIRVMLTAESGEDFVAATRALDRVLTTGRYVIPVWHNPVSYIAHRTRRNCAIPRRMPVYGDWIGWMPEVWWYEEVAAPMALAKPTCRGSQ
jgi:peptide/nickel transport system substrate-binding protein